MGDVLEMVRKFADRVHDGQQRKYTAEKYIAHPVRVMELCERRNVNVSMLAAALLHDVLEDTPISKDELQRFLTGIMPREEALQTVKLVEELTDVYVKKAYPQWNRKMRKRKSWNVLFIPVPKLKPLNMLM